jgi:hypothetical protein
MIVSPKFIPFLHLGPVPRQVACVFFLVEIRLIAPTWDLHPRTIWKSCSLVSRFVRVSHPFLDRKIRNILKILKILNIPNFKNFVKILK